MKMLWKHIVEKLEVRWPGLALQKVYMSVLMPAFFNGTGGHHCNSYRGSL